MGKEKAVCTDRVKQGIHSPLPMGQQVLSHPQKSRAPSHATLGKQMPSLQICLSSCFPPSFVCWAWCQLGSAVPWAVPPSQFPVWPPAHSLAGLCEKQKRPWPRVSPGHQYQNDSCVTNTVSSPKAKQNLAPYYLLCRKWPLSQPKPAQKLRCSFLMLLFVFVGFFLNFIFIWVGFFSFGFIFVSVVVFNQFVSI